MRVFPLLLALGLAQRVLAQDPQPPRLAPSGPPVIPVDRVVATAGTAAILWSEVMEEFNTRRAQGLRVPSDTAQQREIFGKIIDELIDAEVLVQKAVAEKVEVLDGDVMPDVEAQIKQIRDQFQSDAEFRTALAGAGFGTPDEYRRLLLDKAKKQQLQRKLIDKMRADGKMVNVTIPESEVREMYEKNRATLPKRPAQVTFRQIVVPTTASAASKARARAHIDSLLVEINRGGNFEQIAKRESMDPSNKETGGDLGWNRRGLMVPEFDQMMFALPPGAISPVVETVFGFHIIKVEKVQPAEVKARHILIIPRVDSTDETRARLLADSIGAAWRGGSRYDSLSTRFHDPDEVKAFNDPFPKSELPGAYAQAINGMQVNQISSAFQIENQRRGTKKFVVLQLLSSQDEGEYSVGELRERIRSQLVQERSMRRFIDGLRRGTFVHKAELPPFPDFGAQEQQQPPAQRP
jgi:peptidyl-prolyl cis-trans isomerase SurA